MGMLVDGVWQDVWYDTKKTGGSFKREASVFRDWITPDGGPGPQGQRGYPAEAGRYHLYVSLACPWAHRTILTRQLLGLEDAISLGLPGPTHDARSWTFDLDEGGVDPVLGISKLKDAYEKRQPGYPRGVTVPAVVDVPTGVVVTNDFPQITEDFAKQWTAHHREGAPDLSGVLDAPVESATYNGTVFAVPQNTNAQLLYYRTDLVDAAPANWDELKEACSAAEEADAVCARLVAIVRS